MERSTASQPIVPRDRFVLRSLIDAETAKVSGTDSVMYEGAMAPSSDGSFWELNPAQAYLGPSPDRIIKNRADVHHVESSLLDDIFRENALRFIDRKWNPSAGCFLRNLPDVDCLVKIRAGLTSSLTLRAFTSGYSLTHNETT